MKRYITIIILFILLIFTFKNISDLQNHLKFAENESIKNKNQDITLKVDIKLKPLGNFKATFYTSKKAKPITASGNVAVVNKTIAVDKNIIPLHSIVYIKGYGVFVAEDTGRLVKGNRIDIFVENEQKAKTLGIKDIEVYLLK